MIRIINKIYQLFFIAAYRCLLCYWYFIHPKTKGVYIAVWYNGQVLVIKNSYKRYYTFPGGGIKNTETLKQAASRELEEETGIRVKSNDLELAAQIEKEHENKLDLVYFFEVTLSEKPTVKVDHREVVWGSFMKPSAVLTQEISPFIRQYLNEKLKIRNGN